MYLDAMQQVYSNATKVLIDSRQGSNLLYLPLDKIVQMTGQPAAESSTLASPMTLPPATTPVAPLPDARARDAARSRDRETR